jgi:hypothetical protein
MRHFIYIFALLALVSIHTSFADGEFPSDELTNVADGIDIYPKAPSADGENHYIHIEKKAAEDDRVRYIFSYCRNGLPLDQAKQQLFPKVRECYLPIGDANGYTLGELDAEIELMQQQASATSKSQDVSSLSSSVLSAIAVLIVVNIVEVPSGGTAEALTDGAVAVSMFERIRTAFALKTLMSPGNIKILAGAFVGTGVGQFLGSKTNWPGSHKTGDNAFSTPGQTKFAAAEMDQMLSKGNIVVLDVNIESFETELTGILAKIK